MNQRENDSRPRKLRRLRGPQRQLTERERALQEAYARYDDAGDTEAFDADEPPAQRSTKLTPKQVRQRRYFVADHRPADPVVLRLFTDLQAARRVQRRVPAKAERARLFERMAWTELMKYLLTLDCDPQV
jgi:hypothetical protein